MENAATPDLTLEYFRAREVHPDKQRSFDGLHVSALGAGTYLGQADDATDRLYEESLLKAALSGVNFFDTAINYRCMRSEKVIRRVLKELERQGIKREAIVIATKGGFIPCEGTPETFDDTLHTRYLDPGLISPGDIALGCHTIAPAFLDAQITLSLENLGLDTIDLYYIHNPETQLQEIDEAEFYRRLTVAFRLLEQNVQKGRIARYGIATWNGLRQKPNQKTTLQLTKILASAIEAGGPNHHLRAVQMPYNLVMLEALKLKTALADSNIAFMVSSPLMQSHAMSLPARVFDRLPKEDSPALQSLQFLSSTPSACTLFAGMKKIDHLYENTKLLRLPNWPKPDWDKALASITGAPPAP